MSIIYVAAATMIISLSIANYRLFRARKQEEELEAILDNMSSTLKESIELMKSHR